MELFEENDYRSAIRQLVSNYRTINREINYQRMAAYCRMPKSYISRVLKGQNHFNSDQMYLICAYLKLDERQQEYLQLLLELARCGLAERRQKLERRIAAIQAERLKPQNQIKAPHVNVHSNDWGEYYYHPLNQVVHIALEIPAFQRRPESLAAALEISQAQLLSSLQTLEHLKIIKRVKDRLEVNVNKIHLPQDSAMHGMWQRQLRLSSAMRLEKLEPPEKVTFSAVFSSDNAVRQKIRRSFARFISEIEEQATAGKNERVFQLNFDFFSWL